MLSSLVELNDAVNSVVNYLVKKACTETTDGSFRISLDAIESGQLERYVGDADLFIYSDFIASELAARKEMESVDFHDGEFSGICKGEYCPNLEGRQPDEPLLPVRDTLSMTELSAIGKKAISEFRNANISDLRDTLGMDFKQIYKMGLLQQNHFFSVELGDGSTPFGSADVYSAINYMKKQCEKGTAPRLYYNYFDLEEGMDVSRIPLAEEKCAAMASISTDIPCRPTTPSYLESIARVEAAVYDLPVKFSLSYFIDYKDESPEVQKDQARVYLTLQEAMDSFLAKQKDGKDPILSVQLHDINTDNNVVNARLWSKNGRTVIIANQYWDSILYPCSRGGFYSDLARLAFPGREMEVDNWKVKVISPGEVYDSEEHLINESPEALAEFRDMRCAGDKCPDGSLVSRIGLSDLIGKQGIGGVQQGIGIVLDSNPKNMTVSAEQMFPILTWLRLKEVEISKEKAVGLDDKIQVAKKRSEGQSTGVHLQPQKDIEH